MEPACRTLRGLAATVATLLGVGLIGAGSASAADGNTAENAPVATARALSCDAAKTKLKRAKLKRAKAKKAVKRAKKSGTKAKLKKAKNRLRKAKKAVNRAKRQLKSCDGGGPGGGAEKIANEVLSRAPHKPADIDLFNSTYENGAQGIYPQGAPMTPDQGPVPSRAEARGELAEFLRQQLGTGSPEVGEDLAVFDDPAIEEIIPSPTLRAAFVGMKTTLFAPAVDYAVGSDDYYLIDFGPLPNASTVGNTTNGAPLQITFNERYESEDFRLFISVFGHEMLHSTPTGASGGNSSPEEIANYALQGMAEAQLVAGIPALGRSRTELARVMNTHTMLFMNSREGGSPDSEIYAPTGSGLAPGSPFNAPDLWKIYNGDPGDFSPGPPFLADILESLGLPGSTTFNFATAKSFEVLNDKWLSDVGRLRVAVLLEMVSLKDITDVSGLGRQQTIDLLGLQPYLDAID